MLPSAKTKGEILFDATRRPHQRGSWALLSDDEKGHFERAARVFMGALLEDLIPIVSSAAAGKDVSFHLMRLEAVLA